MKTKITDLKPRVRILWNTGTRTILSRKDKAMSRNGLKKALRKEIFS